jgi:hypothetical protein
MSYSSSAHEQIYPSYHLTEGLYFGPRSSGEGGPHQHLDTYLLQNLPQLQTMPVAEADKAWCLATGVPMPLMVLESINSDAKSNNYD